MTNTVTQSHDALLSAPTSRANARLHHTKTYMCLKMKPNVGNEADGAEDQVG